MNLIQLTVSNFKRLSAAIINPAGASFQVAGKNANGKSSVLDAIEWALGGASYAPKKLRRIGATEPTRVVVETDSLIVERVAKDDKDRGGRLVVKRRDGSVFPRGQEHLDGLMGGLAFRPMEFLALKPAEQRQRLLEAIGVDLGTLDQQRDTVFAARTDTNRELKAVEARLAAMPEPAADLPAEEVSVAALVKEVEAVNAANASNAAKRAAAVEAKRQADAKKVEAIAAADEVARLSMALSAAEARQTQLAKEAETKATEAWAHDAEASGLTDQDAEPIRAKIAGAEETNQQIRKAKDREVIAAEVAGLREKSEKATARLEELAAEKLNRVKAAAMPVDGLHVGDDGVLYNGIPLEQASTAEQIRACVGITAALAGELKLCLVRDGNDLDSDSLRMLAEECAARGLQAIVERIEPAADGVVFVIEDGTVATQGGNDV